MNLKVYNFTCIENVLYSCIIQYYAYGYNNERTHKYFQTFLMVSQKFGQIGLLPGPKRKMFYPRVSDGIYNIFRTSIDGY